MTITDVRSIVALKTISAIAPIADADRIEAARIGGWTVVVQRGQYAAGEEVLYFEIDAALPLDDSRFEFLEAKGSKEFGGRSVHVLKTMRLRGTYSQGLVCKLADFADEVEASGAQSNPCPETFAALAQRLAVVKYEPPLPVGSDVIGPWDSTMCRRSDAERIQNLAWGPEWLAVAWTATEKIDGTSTTFDVGADEVRVFSRNCQIGLTPGDARSVIVEELRSAVPVGYTIQGELYGPGIQGNPLRVNEVRFAVFGVFRGGQPVARSDWPQWAVSRAVPIYDLPVLPDVGAMLAAVDGLKSLINPARRAEGVVYARDDGVPMAQLGDRSCFKVISNRYLLSG